MGFKSSSSLGTPQDFLESVVEQDPRPRLKRKVLTTQEITQLKEGKNQNEISFPLATSKFSNSSYSCTQKWFAYVIQIVA